LNTISIDQLGAAAQDFNDATALLQAIQHNQPLPALSSGLNLANDVSGGQVPQLGEAADIAGVVVSLQGLDAAIKHGDIAGGVVAGSNVFAQGVNSYVALEYGDSINAAANGLGDLAAAGEAVGEV